MSSKKSDDRDDQDERERRDDDRDGRRDDDRDNDHGLALVGTSRNDTLTGTSDDDTISGGAGNDSIDGGKGDDTIDGGAGNDRLKGGKGDDTLTGGAGNDRIDGGSGLDVAVYSGNFSDYKLTLSRDGGHSGDDDDDHSAMTVHDLRAGSPDGVDVLKNVEVLRFADGEYIDGRFIPNGPNLDPVAGNDTVAAREDTPLLIAGSSLTSNDSDANGDALSVIGVQAGADTHGSVTLDANTGTVTYVPDANYNGPASFTYTVGDGRGGWATGSVSVNVAAINDAPVLSGLSGPLSYVVGVDSAVLVDNSLGLNDVDSDLLASARIAITRNFVANSDELGFDTLLANDGNLVPLPGTHAVTGTFDANTGVLTFSGSASKAEYEAILESVTFSTGTAGSPREISYTVNDGAADSQPRTTSSLDLGELSSGFRLPGEYANDTSGFSVSGAGDVNGDGFADVIVGAPFAGGGINQSGTSYVVFGTGDPIVEPVIPLSTVGSASTGFKITGGALNGHQGFSVSAAGDVNGDGIGDMIIGAPYADPTGTDSGASYVVFGNKDGFGASLDLSSLSGSNGFRIVGGAAFDHMGYSVHSAGDVNGDGFGDLIVGAPYIPDVNSTSSQPGASYVIFGKAAGFGADLSIAALNGSDGFSLTGVSAYDWVGASVSAAGDINGDGFGDLIVGAPYAYDSANGYSGAAYVVLGSASGHGGNLALSALGNLGFRIIGAAEYDTAGYAVSAAGDVNGDGFGDMVVGAPNASTAHGASGAAYVVFGKSSGLGDFYLSSLAASDGFTVIGAAAGDRAGYAVSAAGDVNGDGYGDLLVGAPDAEVNGNLAGSSYVVLGKASGFGNIDLSTIGGSDGFRISGVANGDDSGYAVSAAGDVNGDGFDDLIVGSQYASPGGIDRAGESYVIFGSEFVVGGETFLGTANSDTDLTALIGTAANEAFIAGQGDDTMFGNGGTDAYSGGAGNDTIHISDSSFLKIDGGSGFDTLALDGAGVTLDLTPNGSIAGDGDRIHDVERIDLTGNGNNTLVLDIRDLLNLSDTSNQLFVKGDLGDAVSSAGQGWLPVPGATPGSQATVTDPLDGLTTYASFYTLGGVANLLIDVDLLGLSSTSVIS